MRIGHGFCVFVSRQIKSFWGVTIAAAAVTLPQPALADSFGSWQRHTTDKGCIYYIYEESVGGMESDPHPEGYIWVGNCTPGQLITGQGTIVAQVNFPMSDGSRLQYVYTKTGKITNGLFEGSVRSDKYDVGPGGSSQWVIDRKWGSTETYRGGCPSDRISNHGCHPNKIEDPIKIPRVSVPYYALPAGFRNGPARSTVASAATANAAGSAVPPLRPTKVLEAHNPANEASKCLEPIAKRDFKRRGVRSIMGAAFRNACAYPVEAQWCIGEGACSRGYGNLATVPAKRDFGFSFDGKADTITTVHWAACRKGFGYRPDFKGTLHHVCK